jgi:hypothetical protein
MLQRTHLFVLATVLTAAAACTTKSTDSDIPPGTGGSGNSGNIGNTGGDTTGGAGGEGATGGTGGTGGSCVGPEDGSGQTAAVCDGMNITPSCVEGGVAAVCNMGGTLYYPDGWRLCHRAFDLFHAGAVDVLVACLEDIGVNPEACEIEPVNGCIDEMYDAACANTEAEETCAALNQGCVEVGDDNFDLAGCNESLRPFSTDGIELYVNCQNDHLDDPCADVHTTCMTEVVTYNPLPAACDEAPE